MVEASSSSSSSFILAAAPALIALALGGEPSLAAPALTALRAAWSLDSPLIPNSSSSSSSAAAVAAVVAPPPSAGELLRALAAAGVALGGGASSFPPSSSAPCSCSSASASAPESRLPGLRLLSRTIRAAALAGIRSGGGKGSSCGRNGKGKGKGKGKVSAATKENSTTNPFGELPGVELFAALSALREDPTARLAEPELGDAAAAVLGAFLRDPSSSCGPSGPGAVARLLHAAAEAALGGGPCGSFCARSALECVRRVPSSASTASGAGADVVRALTAARVASLLAEARRGGREQSKKDAMGSDRSAAVAAEELVLALKPSSSSSASPLSVAEAAPAVVVAIASRLLEGEWFSLGGTALVRGSPAPASAPAASAPTAAQQVRAPRTARLLIEAADEALWPAVEAEVAATAREEEEAAAAEASAAAASNGEFSPSRPSPPGTAAPASSAPPRPRSALAARWLPFVRAVDREAARGRAESDRLLQLAAASMAQRYTVAASAVRFVGIGRTAYGRAGAVGSPS